MNKIEGLELYDASDRLLKPGMALMEIDKNPLLRGHEKQFIKLILRNTKFSPSSTAEVVQAVGITSDTAFIIDTMIMTEGDMKIPFLEVVNRYNRLNNAAFPHSSINTAANPLEMIKAAAVGDVNSLIRRASKGKTNCLEFPLSMQMLAKVYYPDEILQAHILAYNDLNDPFGGTTLFDSRHFGLFTAIQTGEGRDYFFTTYGGRTRRVTVDEATEKKRIAEEKEDYVLESIYSGVLSLISFTEKQSDGTLAGI